MYYFDNAATTQVDEEVLEEMLPYLKSEFANPGGIYSAGRKANDAIEEARQRISDLINCEPEQLIFTSGGSESNNLVLKGVYDYLSESGKSGYISSPIEHDSVLKALEYLKAKRGICLDLLDICKSGTDFGTVRPEVLEKTIDKSTGIVSIMYVNNEIGSINLVKELADVCHKSSVLFHTDCTQALGCVDVDVSDIGCDFASASSHKVHAPKGAGFLYAKDKSLLTPLIHGGDEQEFGLRGGTQNVAAIVGFGKACEILKRDLSNDMAYIRNLNEEFMEALQRSILSARCEIPVKQNNPENGCQKILNLSFEGVDTQTLILLLDSSSGIITSAGSACRSAETSPSRTLTAVGLSPEQAKNSIRISFSKYNTVKDVKYLARAIVWGAELLKSSNGVF